MSDLRMTLKPKWPDTMRIAQVSSGAYGLDIGAGAAFIGPFATHAEAEAAGWEWVRRLPPVYIVRGRGFVQAKS